MSELPLHPLVVHLPIALAVLIPFLALFFMLSSLKRWFPDRVWVLIVILSGIYLASSLVAVEYGEDDEDKVEQVVGHDAIEEHEEAGEKIPWAAGTLFAISFLPLFLRKPLLAQGLTALVGIGGIFLIVKAAHSGGELVYKHGAASAHMNSTAPVETTIETLPAETQDE